MYGRRTLGANTKGLVSTGAAVGASTIASTTAAGAFAGPIGAAAGLVAGLLLSANHPHGTCAPNAKDMASFLKCWGHAIPDNYMPVWTDMWGGSDGKAWVYCSGARGGQPPSGGCRQVGEGGKAYCGPDGVSYLMPVGSTQRNPSGGPCAPPGTLQALKGGGYDISGSAGADPGLGTSTITAALSGDTAGIPNLLLLAAAAVAAYTLL